ncbi:S26 family signal peptidase [Halalkalicoccus subterraneus]|uniref:S26 family signal peptidase n=1 Tax=Halalkalicoccus subterraneus TaxID=2675002 RepID=UPI001FE91A83|nr:S26 family signal peptidase [Halalkalicoccus subterraneus]
MSSPGDGRSPSDEESTHDGERADRPETVRGWLRWFWTVDRGSAMVVREFLVSVGMVLVVGLLLFSLAGVWPPMVAIESGSMEPNMHPNDLVFITDNDRFVNDAAYGSTGVVTYEAGQESGYEKFNGYGDVIIYEPNGNDRQVPIIHRAHFWVEEGENWYDRADPEHVGNAADCEELRNCPAPNAGFITKGDNEVTNQRYDQARGISGPVAEEWVIGTAEVRIPWLGWVRLQLSELAAGGTPQVVLDTSPVSVDTPTSDGWTAPTKWADPIVA